MSTVNRFNKDPAAVLDYRWDWSVWLDDGETITDATVTVPAGLTKNSQVVEASAVTVWVSGGTADSDSYLQLVCHITTSAGRQDDRTIHIMVVDR